MNENEDAAVKAPLSLPVSATSPPRPSDKNLDNWHHLWSFIFLCLEIQRLMGGIVNCVAGQDPSDFLPFEDHRTFCPRGPGPVNTAELARLFPTIGDERTLPLSQK